MQQVARAKLVSLLTSAIIVVFIIAPILIDLFFIYKYGVNCVYADQWEIVPLFDKLYSGTISFTDLFAQHNEHRILLPRLVMLGLGSLTHYNMVAEMYLSWFLLCIICFILFKLFVRLFGFSKGSVAKFVPVVWLVFGLRQYDNLLWGFQLTYFMVVLFFLLAVYLLAESKKCDWRFGLATLSGLAGTFSLAAGLLVWPIGLIQILFTARTRSRKLWGLDIVKTVIWTVTGVAVYIVYFSGYIQPPQTPSLQYSIQNPVMAVNFGLVAFGSPISLSMLTATSVGASLLLLYIFICVAAILKPNTLPFKFPFLSLVLFTLSVVAILAITRSGWKGAIAFESRYTTMTVLGIIGLYTLILSTDIEHIKFKYFLTFFLIALIIAGIGPTSVPIYWEIGNNSRFNRQNYASYLITYIYQEDENIIKLYPWPEIVRARSEILIKYKLNVFHDEMLSAAGLTPLNKEPLYHIDALNGQTNALPKLLSLETEKGDSLKIRGWAVDQDNSKTAGGVLIAIDGNLEVPALYGLDRPDIAAFHKNSNYRYSGFEASIPASVIGPGRHVIDIMVISADGSSYYLPVQILTLDIK